MNLHRFTCLCFTKNGVGLDLVPDYSVNTKAESGCNFSGFGYLGFSFFGFGSGSGFGKT